MIWFNQRELEKKISDNGLTELDGINYFIASIIYSTIFSSIGLTQGLSYYSMLTLLANGIAIILTIYYSYNIHRQGNSFDFFQKYFALTWVIHVRLFLVWLIYVFIFLTIFNIRQPNPAAYSLSFLFQIIMDIAYFVMTINSFNRVSDRHKF